MYETTRKDCPMGLGVCCYQYADDAHPSFSVSVMYWMKVGKKIEVSSTENSLLFRTVSFEKEIRNKNLLLLENMNRFL